MEKKESKIGAILKFFWTYTKKYTIAYPTIVISVSLSAIINLFVPLYYKKFFDTLALPFDLAYIPVLIKIIIITFGLKVAIWMLWRVIGFLTNHVETRAIADMATSAFGIVLKHSYSFFNNTFAGSLAQKLNRLTRAYERIYDDIHFTLLYLIVSISSIFVVVFTRFPIIGYILVVWLLLIVLLSFFVFHWKQKFEESRAEADSKASGTLLDAITNTITIKLFSGYQHEQDIYRTAVDERRQRTVVAWTIDEYVRIVQGIVMIGLEFGVFYVGLFLWKKGGFTIGDFVLIQTYVLNLASGVWGLSNVLRSLYQAFADSREAIEILEMPYEVKDYTGARLLHVTRGEIIFDNVCFSFNETRTLLKQFNLHVTPGEKVALVGSSGAGKSTITKLLFRLHDVESGLIMIDGQNIAHVTQDSLRDAIALVPQEPILFHRSLMENIRYGRRDATDEEVFEAAQKAHCHDFIQELPDGYNTLVGERGVKLSGGERQRVAIARAILKKASILVLDEATSSLDSESEHLIQDALEKLMEGKTTIVIAHRLSTVMKMNRIIVLDQGNVVTTGTHDELVRHEGIYKKLWSIQAGGFLQDEE